MKNAGFSLVEVLVVCAIMGVVALGISQMMIGQARQQANAQRKLNFQQLVAATQAAVSSPAAVLQSSNGLIPESNFNCGTPPKACAQGCKCEGGACVPVSGGAGGGACGVGGGVGGVGGGVGGVGGGVGGVGGSVKVK